MKLNDYCLIARVMGKANKLPEGLNFYILDPDAEVFDLAEGKNIVIADNKKLGNYKVFAKWKSYMLPTTGSSRYGMIVVGEGDNVDGQYIACASTREELYDLYAEMYSQGVIGASADKYLPRINKFMSQKYSKDNIK